MPLPFQNHHSNKQAWAGRVKTMVGNRTRKWTTFGIPIFTVAIFISDIFTPLGISDWAWYFVPLLLSADPRVRFSPYLLTIIFSVLTVLGHFLSPPCFIPFVGFVNRCIGITVLWLVACLVSNYRQTSIIAYKLSSMVEQSPIAIGIADRFCSIQFVNTQFTAMTGYSSGEVIGKHLRVIFGEMPPSDDERVRAAMNTGTAWRGEYQSRRKTGEYFWVSASLSLLFDAAGQITHFVVMYDDITERKQGEKRIAQLSRMREILSGVDRAIIHIPDQQKLLDEICRVAVEKGDFKLAWAGLITPDGSVIPVAMAGKTEYLEGARFATQDVPEGCGPVGMAIRENLPVVIDDVDQDARMDPWRQQLQQFELRYVAAFPIRIGTKVAGAFQVYAPQIHFFNENELGLLTQMSDDISFALTAIADFTARKQAEEQLRKLSRAVEQSPVSIVITDDLGSIEYVNPKFTELTGYTADEVRGQNPRMLKSGETPVGEYECLWQTITQGQNWYGEFHNRKKNGEIFWEHASISPITNPDGKITHFVAVKEDITERKKAEQAVRESEERYRLISENVADIVCQMDPISCKFSYVSPSVRGLLGYTQAETLAKTMMDVLSPDSQKKAVELFAVRNLHFLELSSGTTSYQDEFDVLRKDGSTLTAEITSTFMRNEFAEPNIIAVVRDVTERKRMEGLLRAERERLEREVLRRIEMEQERIGRDLHDGLCQILVGAKYRIGVLEKILTDTNQSSAAEAAKIVERMLNNTIQQARDLAKGLNPVRLGAKGLVFELEELAKEVETSGSAQCHCRFYPATLISDRNVVNHLYRITQEAVQNAIKHGQARNISIILQEQTGKLILTVGDDGVGFSANPEDSNGAGLHNMRIRAAMIGGTLAIRPGRLGGSVISVSLPVKAQQE